MRRGSIIERERLLQRGIEVGADPIAFHSPDCHRLQAGDEAAAIGYPRVYLDTLPTMTEAAGLYRSLGFRPVGPYLPDPVPGTVCMALDLPLVGVTTGSRI